MQLLPVSGALGAEVAGVEPADAFAADTAAALLVAFARHKVLFFRGRVMTPDEHLRFSRIFGEPDRYPFLQGLPEAPDVIEILKTERDTVNFGGNWHSDTAYLKCPALGTVLQALEVPDAGGDTLFADTAAAYDALSPGMRRVLAPLRGINSSEARYQDGREAAMARLDGMHDAAIRNAPVYESSHPVVRTHPVTGCKSLYLNGSHTRRFAGMRVILPSASISDRTPCSRT